MCFYVPGRWIGNAVPVRLGEIVAESFKCLSAFVADAGAAEKLPTHLTFLLNFFDELRRKAAAGK